MLADSSWHQGRRGEYLQQQLYCDGGCHILDIGGTTLDRAPMLRGLEQDVAAPDMLAWRSGALFGLQFKAKERLERWGGGSPLVLPRWPARTEEGIDRRCYESHLAFEQRTGIVVVLSSLVIETGTLYAARLSSLGQPRPSADARWDVLNWDIREFRPLWRCRPWLLRDYFFDHDGRHRLAPVDAPTARQMQRWLARLQGQFIEGAMAAAEQEWLGERQFA